MFRLLGLSFTDEAQGGFSLANYARLGDSFLYWRILGITLEISALTAIFSVLFGYPIAMWLAGLEDRKRGNMLMLVLLPFWTSYLVKTFAWMILLGKTVSSTRSYWVSGLRNDLPISCITRWACS